MAAIEYWIDAIARLEAEAKQSHRSPWRWRAPVTSHALSAFEREHRIELPDDYRRVLLDVGNGAEGALDVFPLGGIVNDGQGQLLAEWGAVDLRKKFPFRAKQDYWDDDGEVEGDEDDDPYLGSLPVANSQAGGLLLLIVTGKESGKMWEHEGDISPAPNPLLRTLTFVEWVAVEMAKALDKTELIASWRSQ